MKNITTGLTALKQIQSGINKLANIVKKTLGPGGANIILEKPGSLYQITRDGVTVARDIGLPETLENLGAHLVKESASRTVDTVGDGTSTSTILTQAIFNEGLKAIFPHWPFRGAQRSHIKRGIEAAVRDVVACLKTISQPIEMGDLFKIAKIAANSDESIAHLINDSVGKVGREGLVSVEDVKGTDSFVTLVEGVRFDRGYLSGYFVTNQAKMESDLANVEVLIFDGIISKFREQLLPILEKRRKRGFDLPLLIIAEDVNGEALATLALNHHNNSQDSHMGMAVCVVQAPDFGDSRKESLKDLAALTGGKVIAKEAGLTLEKAGLEVLGTAKRVRTTQWHTTIIEGGGGKESVDARVQVIRQQIEESNPQAVVKLKERLARVLNGMAVINIGGVTEVEIREKKDRVEDALMATRAALEEGVIIGGGMCFVHIHERLKDAINHGSAGTVSLLTSNYSGLTDDEITGYRILIDALKVPFLTIVANVEENPIKAYKKVVTLGADWGFNAMTREYEDLTKAGVIDPTKVARLALENAASVAGILLSTDGVVSFAKTK